MSSGGVDPLLVELSTRLPQPPVLWRGEEPGSDIDLLVFDSAEPELSELLGTHGLEPRAEEPGHVVWRSSQSEQAPPLDVLRASAWPSYYPSLPGVMSRARYAPAGPAVASPADRALIFAAEAVLGRPLEKVVRRLRALLDEPEARAHLRAVAASERLEELAALAEQPEGLLSAARRGRLPYRNAVALALRSGAARRAVRARVSGRLARMIGGRPREARRQRRRRKPLLVTVSGMDGAGKSTVAELIEAQLRDGGLPTEIVWARIGGESQLLDPVAVPVKRLLRRSGTVADPVAAGGPAVEKTQDPVEAQGRRRLVSWVWIVIVALANARSYRRAAAGRRRGTHVVCDRWATDAFVDLELRYGRHRLAEAALRLMSPRRDLGILLEIDSHTAASRKPGDQAAHVLAAMEPLYARRARIERLVRLDARRPRVEIERAVAGITQGLILR